MSTSPRRTALALAVAAVLSAGVAGTAVAAPAPKVPAPPAVAKVLPQVLLRVTPVAATPSTTDYTAVVTVKAPAHTVVTGSYQLLDGGAVVASGQLAAGAASVPLDLTPGTHRLTAVFGGAAKVNGAGSSLVVVPVPAA